MKLTLDTAIGNKDSSQSILAIDPGYDKVGYAVMNMSNGKPNLIKSGLIKTAKNDSFMHRLSVICINLVKIVKKYQIHECVMEQLFYFKNAKTVIAVAQAQGAIIQTCSSHAVSVAFLTPLQIKLIVAGHGQADKAGVWKMLRLQLGQNIGVADDDESDAIACGFAHLSIRREF
jgi:crossover junction endodeoxyribonuclease RuvC